MSLDNIFVKFDTPEDDIDDHLSTDKEHKKLLNEIKNATIETEINTTKQIAKIGDETKKLINELNQALEDSDNMEVVIQGLLSILKDTQIANATLKGENIKLKFMCDKYKNYSHNLEKKIIELENNLKNNFFTNYRQ